MRRVSLLLAVLCIGSLFSPAQTPAPDSPASRDDILQLFDTMHLRDQMRLVMDSIATQQRTMLRDTMRKRFPNITDEELEHLSQFTGDILKDLPIDGMLDDMVPIYQKHLTKVDVAAMSAYYSSPTGQKMLREMPAMTAESMQATGPRIQAMMDKAMDRAEQMAQEERQKKTESPKPETRKN